MSDVTMGPKEPIVSDHFVDREQQNEASHIGMWLFLAQEAMFFGGLLCAYFYYRYQYPDVFQEGSEQLNYWMGMGNTVVLLLSSVTMAMCVWATQVGKWKQQMIYLLSTVSLGVIFLVVKAFEYRQKWDHGLVPHFNWNPRQDLNLRHFG